VAEAGLDADPVRDDDVALPKGQRRAVQVSFVVDQRLPHVADS
jgi:hypothetical protein